MRPVELIRRFGVLAAGFLVAVALAVPAVYRSDVGDYYDAAVRVRQGRPLYRAWPEYGPDVMCGPRAGWPSDQIPYPPVLPRLLAPATRWSKAAVGRAGVVLMGGAAALFVAQLGAPGPAFWVGCLFLVPGMWALPILGNVDPVLWALWAVGLRRPAWRGGLWALAATVKGQTLPVLVLAGLWEGRRVAVPALVVAVIAAGVGWGEWGNWARDMLPTIPAQGTLVWWNVSLSMATLRLARALGWWHYAGGPLAPAVRAYLGSWAVALPLGAFVATRGRPREVRYGWVLVGLLAGAPLCWSYNAAYVFMAWKVGREHGDRGRGAGAVPGAGDDPVGGVDPVAVAGGAALARAGGPGRVHIVVPPALRIWWA